MAPRPPSDAGSLTLVEAAQRLGVHYMTVYRYVRTGRLPATKAAGQWRVAAADVESMRAGADGSDGAGRAVRPRRRRADHAGRLEARLLAGDEAGAWAVIEGAMASGASPERIYLEMLAPVLASIGDRWATGELDVAREHQASAVATRLVGRLGPRFIRRGRKRGTVVIGAAPDDSHGLPVAMLADLLRARSFDVVDLGADVPARSFAATVEGIERLVAIGICATTPRNRGNVVAAVEALRRVTDATIVIGGAGAPSSLGSYPGVVCCTHTAPDAITEFEKIAPGA
jgi:MerR family transcriptional regulator, light-induced transcriptional regulator